MVDERYLDSASDGIINESVASTEFAGLIEPSSDPSVRQVPGMDGFRLADTPQCWVFIQKKQWDNEQWTYVVDDGTLGEAQEELATAEATWSKNKTKANKDAIRVAEEAVNQEKKQTEESGEGSSAFDGKTVEINVRTALGNIITRKLDWMNDHEKFTKVSSAVNNVVEQTRAYDAESKNTTRQELQKKLDIDLDHFTIEQGRSLETLNSQNEKYKLDIKGIELVLESNRQKVEEKSDMPIIYIKETPGVDSSFLPATIGELFETDEEGSFIYFKSERENFAALADPLSQSVISELEIVVEESAELAGSLAKKTTQFQKNENVIKDIKENPRPLEEDAEDLQKELDDIVGSEFVPTTLSGNAFTRYYQTPELRTKHSDELKEYKKRLKEIEKDIESIKSQGKNNVARTTEEGSIQKSRALKAAEQEKRLYEAKIRTILHSESMEIEANVAGSTSGIASSVYQNKFNGVIELANVSQVSTSLTLDGQGTASFSIESPQDIFRITPEDIVLALTEDPFLSTDNFQKSGNEVGALMWYRGRYYPSRIVKMLTQGRGAAVSYGQGLNAKRIFDEAVLFTDRALYAKYSKKRWDALNKIIADLEIEEQEALVIIKEISSLNSPEVIDKKQQLASIQADIAARKEERDQAILATKEAQDASEDEITRLEEIRRILTKYFAGKSIFEVMDRVYIWMTTPTRTPFRLPLPSGETVYAIEDPSAISKVRIVAKAEEDVESIVKEIDRAKKYLLSIGASFKGNQIQTHNDDLDRVGISRFKPDPSYIKFSPFGYGETEGSLVADYYRALYSRKIELDGEVEFLKAEIYFTTDSRTSANTFGGINKSGQMSDLNKETYESHFLGLEEQRLQVFQGLIGQVQQTYSNGKFQINISCQDNTVFLSLSRIMIKPALRKNGEPIGVLQDPIWRNGKHNGRWKNGTLVLDSIFVNDETKATMDEKEISGANGTTDKKITGDKEGRLAYTPYVTSLPFAKLDAANLVSFIITGFPYDFEMFVKNAELGGRLLFDLKSAITDQRLDESSYFVSLKQSIGEQNDRLGDFEPFIDVGSLEDDVRETSKKDLENLQVKAVEALQISYINFALDSLQRYNDNNSSFNIKTNNSSASGEKEKIEDALTAGREDSMIIEIAKIKVEEAKGNDPFAGTRPSTADENDSEEAPVGLQALAKKFIDLLKEGSPEISQTLIAARLKFEKEMKTRVEAQEALLTKRGIEQVEKDRILGNLKISMAVSFIESRLLIEGSYRADYQKVENAASQLRQHLYTDSFLNHFKEEIGELKDRQSRTAPLSSTIEKIVKGRKKNFLVISDQYQFDQSIQAYNVEVGSSSQINEWQSEFEFPISVCKRAAEQLDFEFYADEDGNLRFKPPTYNRILKEHYDQLSNMDSAVRDAMLIRFGSQGGQLLRAFLRAQVIANQAMVDAMSKQEKARADEEGKEEAHNKKIRDIKAAIEYEKASVKKGEKSVKVLENEKAAADAADAERDAARERADAFDPEWEKSGKVIDERFVEDAIGISKEVKERVANIKYQAERYIEKKESDYQSARLERFKKDRESIEKLTQEIEDLEKITPKPTQKIKDKQIEKDDIIARREIEFSKNETQILSITMKIYAEVVKNLQKMIKQLKTQVDDIRTRTRSKVDTLERFSGEDRIHRVQSHDLIDYNMSEAAPRFTYLEVIGEPEITRIGGGGGLSEAFYWTGGVDYDLWRNYGFKTESVSKAYYNGGGAGKTYCRALLGRERGRIFSGTINVRGDSKYKLGDCVFIEDLSMYYYVEGVNHSFSYGQRYATSLTLAYGRRIGEIIPHPFDVLGGIVTETYQSELETLLAQEKVYKEKTIDLGRTEEEARAESIKLQEQQERLEAINQKLQADNDVAKNRLLNSSPGNDE